MRIIEKSLAKSVFDLPLFCNERKLFNHIPLLVQQTHSVFKRKINLWFKVKPIYNFIESEQSGIQAITKYWSMAKNFRYLSRHWKTPIVYIHNSIEICYIVITRNCLRCYVIIKLDT